MELELTDVYENSHQSRRIYKTGVFEIDIRSDKNGVTVEILRNDNVVADCSADIDV